jgi:hypothetical protein
MGIGSFQGVESGQGMTLTPHPLLVPRSKNRVELRAFVFYKKCEIYLYCIKHPTNPEKLNSKSVLPPWVLYFEKVRNEG